MLLTPRRTVTNQFIQLYLIQPMQRLLSKYRFVQEKCTRKLNMVSLPTGNTKKNRTVKRFLPKRLKRATGFEALQSVLRKRIMKNSYPSFMTTLIFYQKTFTVHHPKDVQSNFRAVQHLLTLHMQFIPTSVTRWSVLWSTTFMSETIMP